MHTGKPAWDWLDAALGQLSKGACIQRLGEGQAEVMSPTICSHAAYIYGIRIAPAQRGLRMMTCDVATVCIVLQLQPGRGGRDVPQ